MCIAIDTTDTDQLEREAVEATPRVNELALDPVLRGVALSLVGRRKADAAISLEQLARRLRESDPHRHAALLVMLSGGALG